VGFPSGYKFDDKKPDAPALSIQFAHFHSVNHLIMMRKAMRFYADHKYLTGMTITNRKMLVHPELETVLSKLDLCHVYVCLVVDFSCPFVLMLQHCSYISKICAEISDNSKKG